MDSGSANEDFFKAHPDWFSVNVEGKPYMRNGLYITCVNGPYYNEHIPSILKEIVTTYKPEGVTDNSWAGLGRESPCFCENCTRSFREKTGKEIPRVRNWDDPAFRDWMVWNYQRRLELWDMNNNITKTAGGSNCTWSGMNAGQVISTGTFRDLKEICKRADIIMLDHQARSDAAGFQQNAEAGKYIHDLLGWDKIAPESMAMYQSGSPRFRVASKAKQEAEMWMLEGFAGGIAPWWHHVSGYHEDRRMYKTVQPVYDWHKANEQFLYDRTPVANVGVVWSQENTDFFGRDDVNTKVEMPWRGIINSLIRARIPFVPVNADNIERESGKLSVLILPNVGLLTDDQVSSIRKYVEGGGGLIATGESGLYGKFGDQRQDYALSDLFGAHKVNGKVNEKANDIPAQRGITSLNSYLRLTPELRKNVDGPINGTEPNPSGIRHPVFKGFEETDILPFGGLLDPLNTDANAQVLMTFIPVLPTLPPEDAWMRVSKTDIPGLIINTTNGGSRIVFMPADIDRQFANSNHPDHGNLLANIIRWTSKDNIPLSIEGAGLIDCNVYRQPSRMILHLTNLVSAATWRQTLDEYIPIGPITVNIRISDDVPGSKVKSLVSKQQISPEVKEGWCRFTLNSILNHEVIVIS
jgi:hypothetical protein